MVEASGIGEHLFELWKVLEGTFLNDICTKTENLYQEEKLEWNGINTYSALWASIVCVCVI